MTEEKKTVEPELPALVKKAPELIPLWDWWVKEGKSTVTMLLAAGVVVAGFYAGRNWFRARDAKANAALVNAYAVDELENAVSSFGSAKPGVALKMRLAKSYFDAERYQDALDVYETLVKKADPAFVDVAIVGRAYALEGLAKYAEAREAFAAYAGDAAKTNSYLILAAQMGAARCTALAGDKAAAVRALEDLKAKQKDDAFAEARVTRMLDAVKRYDPARKAPSLFDAANAAAAAVEGEKKEAAKPTPKPAPAAKPAPAKPTPAKPAAK